MSFKEMFPKEESSVVRRVRLASVVRGEDAVADLFLSVSS
jgi:hypothetical protein